MAPWLRSFSNCLRTGEPPSLSYSIHDRAARTTPRNAETNGSRLWFSGAQAPRDSDRTAARRKGASRAVRARCVSYLTRHHQRSSTKLDRLTTTLGGARKCRGILTNGAYLRVQCNRNSPLTARISAG